MPLGPVYMFLLPVTHLNVLFSWLTPTYPSNFSFHIISSWSVPVVPCTSLCHSIDPTSIISSYLYGLSWKARYLSCLLRASQLSKVLHTEWIYKPIVINIPLRYGTGQIREAYRAYVQQAFLYNRYNHILISTIHWVQSIKIQNNHMSEFQ